jgi:hydroxymethylpyrimidine/phosphomethylpyrimidine kinase
VKNTKNYLPVVLSIAGSDPSGGAGIQADIKTFMAVGVYGAAAITWITCQNTTGVFTLMPLPIEIIREQISRVMDDFNVSHIKIGMIGNYETASLIKELLVDFSGEIIFDPVYRASSGDDLTNSKNASEILDPVISCSTVLTPNLNELQALAKCSCYHESDIKKGVQYLLTDYNNLKAIIVKGGHFREQQKIVKDFLFLRGSNDEAVLKETAEHSRVITRNSHGTGCTFSSAFAGFHQKYSNYEIAFSKSIALAGRLLKESRHFSIGQGTGPLLHHLCFPGGE